ncbi:MAG: hypothetical protein GQ570_12905 [Helicobacteraceae bacterium]|nr:hypothetical protein [Helicobacteraceae bacterium]
MPNELLIQETQKQLENTLPYDYYALDFTKDSYQELLHSLQNRLDRTIALDDIIVVRTTIQSYFQEHFQDVTVNLISDEFQLVKYFIDPTFSEKMDREAHKVRMELYLAARNETKYKEIPLMWVLPEEINQKSLNVWQKLCANSEDAKTNLRDEVNLVFKLQDRDIVLFFANSIYIRLYEEVPKVTDGSERRYGGIGEKVLDELYVKMFPHGAKPRFETILEDIFEEKLDFKHMNNRKFAKIFIPTLTSIIDTILLEEELDQSSEMFSAFSNYILRKYFFHLLQKCAEELLSVVTIRNPSAETFIKYYIDNTMINDSGKKVTYRIIDDSKKVYRFADIISLLGQRSQVQKRLELYEKKTQAHGDETDAKMKKIEEDTKKEEDIHELLASNKKRLKNAEIRVEELADKKSFFSSKAHDEKMELAKKELAICKDRKQYLRSSLTAINSLQLRHEVELENWHKVVDRESLDLNKITEEYEVERVRYELLVDAVAKVLSKR